MSTRITVATIAGCALNEVSDRVVLSVENRRGQAVDLVFKAADFTGLMPTFLAIANALNQRSAADQAIEQPWLNAAPVTELETRQLEGGVVALGLRLAGTPAELWLACSSELVANLPAALAKAPSERPAAADALS